ncbi:MAG TPA: tetratricopeptide repeat protein, partial [Candidatus Eisenbacteria bacterium]
MGLDRVCRGAALPLLLALIGCADPGALPMRYRAERALWEAQREETRLRLAGERPDSVSLTRLRDQYRRLRARFPVPPPATPGTPAEQVRADMIRILGRAELSGARLALLARQPSDALEHARWAAAAAAAGRDTVLGREAELRIVDALQALGRHEEAVDTMWAIVDRFPAVAPRTGTEEDPILRMPGVIAAVHLEMGDTAAARRDHRRAVQYYARLIASGATPLLEAQVRTLMVQAQLALGDRQGALRTLVGFEKLVNSAPALKSRLDEVLFTKGSVQAMPGGNLKEALATYGEVAKRYPDSPYAARALVESGVALERQGRRGEALAQYREALDRFPKDLNAGPIALFRSAMLKDQMDDWAGAKQDLEALPLRFPASRGAVEAPVAVVAHYQRSGEGAAMRAALLRAIETYRGLIARDSTSAMNATIRWNIARCYAGLDRPKEALAVVDEMTRKDRGSPLTAHALREGAELAVRSGDVARARVYLEQFLLYFPQAPDA